MLGRRPSAVRFSARLSIPSSQYRFGRSYGVFSTGCEIGSPPVMPDP